MGFRFRKSVKIAPGVRLNFGNKSSSVSFGGKGFRHTISTSGRRTTSVGIPGTGLSYSETHGRKKTSSTKSAKQGGSVKKHNSPIVCSKCGAELSSKAKVCRYCRTKVKKPSRKKWWAWILVLALLGSCGRSCTDADTQEQATNIESNEATVSDDTTIEQSEPEEVPVVVEPEEVPIEIQPTVEEVQEPVPSVVETQVQEDPGTKTVYITETGSKYHRGTCRHLDSKIQTTVSDAKARGFTPCGTCDP